MQIMKLIIRFLPYVLVFVFGGIFVTITRSLSFFVYENTFNIFELLYFILSAGIALFITGRIDDALQRKRSQKDLILKKMEEVDSAIKDLNDLFIFESNKYKLANTPFLGRVKSIGMWAKRYEESISTYYNKLDSTKAYVKLNTRKLVKVCTKINGQNEEDISCKNDVWYYSEGKYIQIKTEIENIRTICYKNMILLNNYE